MREVFFMFVYSLKGKSIKLVGIGIFLCAAVVFSISLLPEYEGNQPAYLSAATQEPISFSNIKTEEDRQALIEQLGIQTDEAPIEEYKTRVPKEFDAVYQDYNKIQLAQGFDLTDYRGKKVTRYTYKVLNYPKKSENERYENVFLNLILYKNRVIGGDISTTEHGGFVRTFCNFVP